MEERNKMFSIKYIGIIISICLFCLILYGCDRENNTPSSQQPPNVGIGSTDSTSGEGDSQINDTDNGILQTSPGFFISEIVGNTASSGAIAEFYIHLQSKPTDNVSVQLASSNKEQGTVALPNNGELIFTTNNWNIGQIVRISGKSDDIPNGEQNYQIITSPSQSLDPNYSGLDPKDIEIKGIVLQVLQLEKNHSFIPEFPETRFIKTSYNGDYPEKLSLSLLDAPEGMTINKYGEIKWTAPESAAGQSFNVTILMDDSNKSAQTSFIINVTKPMLIETKSAGNTSKVIDQSSSFYGSILTAVEINQDAWFSSSEENPSNEVDIDISKVQLFEIPYSSYLQSDDDISPITNVLIIKNDSGSDLRLTIPSNLVPNNLDNHSIALHTPITITHSNNDIWGYSSSEQYFTNDKLPDSIDFNIARNDGIYLVAAYPIVEIEPIHISDNIIFPQSQKIKEQSSDDSIECKWKKSFVVCSMNNMKLQITGVGGTILSKKNFLDEIINNIASIIYYSKKAAENLSLTPDNKLSIGIGNTKYGQGNSGYLYTGYGDTEAKNTIYHYRLIILKPHVLKNVNIRSLIAHEYMHHAQAFTSGTRGASLTGVNEREWFIEGTAEWFSDWIYDKENYYKRFSSYNLEILENGLNISNKSRNEKYLTFSFWKMLSSQCSLYNNIFINMINFNYSSDPYRLHSFKNSLANSNCFLDGYADSPFLPVSLAYYQYATQKKNKISLLDFNEPDSFVFRPPIKYRNSFKKGNLTWHNTIDDWLSKNNGDKYRLKKEAIPPVSAFSFIIDEIIGKIPKRAKAVLEINYDKPLFVSILPGNAIPSGKEHVWEKTTEKTWKYEINEEQPIEELFVTIVNPDIDNYSSPISIEGDAETTIPGISFSISNFNILGIEEYPAIVDTKCLPPNGLVVCTGQWPKGYSLWTRINYTKPESSSTRTRTKLVASLRKCDLPEEVCKSTLVTIPDGMDEYDDDFIPYPYTLWSYYLKATDEFRNNTSAKVANIFCSNSTTRDAIQNRIIKLEETYLFDWKLHIEAEKYNPEIKKWIFDKKTDSEKLSYSCSFTSW